MLKQSLLGDAPRRGTDGEIQLIVQMTVNIGWMLDLKQVHCGALPFPAFPPSFVTPVRP